MKSELKIASRSATESYLAGWEIASNNYEQWSQDWNTISSKPTRLRKKK